MILGIDPGDVRVGVAIADEETRFARPLEIIDRRSTDPVERIAELVRELDVRLVVVGRPVSLSGHAGPAVEKQRLLVEALTGMDLRVAEFDERLTTVVAEQGLRAAGGSRKRSARVKDAIAAQVMLQGFLDAQGPEE